jgi:hypothetical protein
MIRHQASSVNSRPSTAIALTSRSQVADLWAQIGSVMSDGLPAEPAEAGEPAGLADRELLGWPGEEALERWCPTER